MKKVGIVAGAIFLTISVSLGAQALLSGGSEVVTHISEKDGLGSDALTHIRQTAGTILGTARLLRPSTERRLVIRNGMSIVDLCTSFLTATPIVPSMSWNSRETQMLTQLRYKASAMLDAARRLPTSTKRKRIVRGSSAIIHLIPPPGGGGSAPRPGGYFHLRGPGAWSSLPSGQTCAGRVHTSSWEPRPENRAQNHMVPRARAVASSFSSRPRSNSDGTYAARWDSWLLPRVDGSFRGTTDEIFQWAACKWGFPDNLLRGIAVRESTWYQDLTKPDGTCVEFRGCGDRFTNATPASTTYCEGLAKVGHHDYQPQFGGRGFCPKTFSIVGVMSWDDPAWRAPARAWPDNQNGTFPFSRDSTAFAVDYLGSYLRGCYDGWITWLHPDRGDIWGCVGSWYSGDWHSSAADGYAARVQSEIRNHTWLRPAFSDA